MAGIPKITTEDTRLVTSNIHGEKTTVPIPKGTDVVIDTPGVHYNRTYSGGFLLMPGSFFFSQNKTLSARYWKDPHTFNPSRFLATDWPRDAFIPFSSGEKFWNGFYFLRDNFLNSYEIYAGARACIGRKYTSFFQSKKKLILTKIFFFCLM